MQFEVTVRQIVEQLTHQPAAKIEMVISFVKDHRIECKLVNDHPKLAALISTKSLPLQVIEDLFEAAKNNSVFKLELEQHIKSCFAIVPSLNLPQQKIDTMKTINEVSSVTVPVTYYKPDNVTMEEAVAFTISRKNNRYKAIPRLTKEERKQTGLPEELEFVYYNYCIVEANNMEEDALNAIKQIIQELEAQEYFD